MDVVRRRGEGYARIHIRRNEIRMDEGERHVKTLRKLESHICSGLGGLAEIGRDQDFLRQPHGKSPSVKSRFGDITIRGAFRHETNRETRSDGLASPNRPTKR